jgi:hypothetical protein
MGGLTGVLVRRSHDPESHRRQPLRLGIRRREVAVDRYVTEVVMDDGEVVPGGRAPRIGWRWPVIGADPEYAEAAWR